MTLNDTFTLFIKINFRIDIYITFHVMIFYEYFFFFFKSTPIRSFFEDSDSRLNGLMSLGMDTARGPEMINICKFRRIFPPISQDI